MKTSQILASLFFGSLAAAVPINQRDLVTKTEMVMETVVVYTTIWDDEPVAEATTTAAAFFEQPAPSAEAKPTTTPAPAPAPVPTPAAVESPKSVYTPVVETPKAAPTTTQAAPKPVTTQAAAAPAPTTEAPAPKPEPTTEAAPAPAPTTTTEAAAPPAATSAAAQAPSTQNTESSSSSGGEFSGDITIYQTEGGYGACGTALHDDDMIVALSHVKWGASTYDVMTGEATNPWCGQEIEVHYKGNSIKAKIMDMCPGCSGDDIDLSPKAWKALTGSDEMTRYQATWSKVS